ncbi:MAG: DpnII family type II restriction endonuclease [Planctomycetota bacterium]
MLQILTSRKIPPEQFLREFLSTLTPGIIPRAQFIKWVAIEEKIRANKNIIETFSGFHEKKGAKLIQELADCLQSSDNPEEILKGAFEFLGHTGEEFVSTEDNVTVHGLSDRIRKEGEAAAQDAARLFSDLGIEKILEREDLAGTFLGVQIGLETHRRKNVGGEAFNTVVGNFLKNVVTELRPKLNIALKPELRVLYEDGKTSKKVDFGLLIDDKPRVGIEVNFYTGSGSKPTEIKRSYADVNRHLETVGVALVWITDGNGYLKMRRSMQEAFEAHPNTYNFEMAKKHLKNDLLTKFG